MNGDAIRWQSVSGGEPSIVRSLLQAEEKGGYDCGSTKQS